MTPDAAQSKAVIVTVEIHVEAAPEDAEGIVEAALDNMASSGGEITGYMVMSCD